MDISGSVIEILCGLKGQAFAVDCKYPHKFMLSSQH